METNNISTKFGKATITHGGYYRISTRTEGNKNKFLHRLIFEDYHNCTLDENDVIHHIDGDKLNNHPANLICMSKEAHLRLHHKKYDKYSLVKDGKTWNGKQLYTIYSNKKRIKSSIYKDKLERYLIELEEKEAQQCLN